MTIDHNYDEDGFRFLARARQVLDHMAPKATDSTEVRVLKEVFRWSSTVAGATAAAVVVLESGHSAQ